MKKNILILVCMVLTNLSFGQESDKGLKMISDYSSDNPEVKDILQFEGIEYWKLKFIGQELKTKSYKLTVKEIWDGKIVKDTIVFDSKSLFKQFERVNDTILNLKVISKMAHENKLKMTFLFPRFSITKEYDAIKTNKYRLRNIVEESKMEIEYGKKFYLLAYILPYQRENGVNSWCDVGTNGKDIENWGEKFRIKHYLVFEMIFE